MAEKPDVTISLTPEQQQQVRKATGKEIKKLTIEPLEDRIATKLAANCKDAAFGVTGDGLIRCHRP